MLRYFKRVWKRVVLAWYERRGKPLVACDDETCLKTPRYYVMYDYRIRWDRSLNILIGLGLKPLSHEEMKKLMGFDRVGTSGCFCTQHTEALKRDPECEVQKVVPRLKAA